MRLKLLVILSCAFTTLALAPHIPQKNYYEYRKHVSLPKVDKNETAKNHQMQLHFNPIVRIDQRLSLIPTQIAVHPIDEGSLSLQMNQLSVFIDPNDDERFFSFKKPDFIFITHEDKKHLNIKSLEGLVSAKTKIIAPPKAIEIIKAQSPLLTSQCLQMLPGESQVLIDEQDAKKPVYQRSLAVLAVPMIKASEHYPDIYRGNGYVLSYIDNHIYISGDNETQDVLDVILNTGLTIDMALMPLYSKNFSILANAISPKVVIPYHYGSNQPKQENLTLAHIDTHLNKDIKRVFLKWNTTPSTRAVSLRDAHQSLVTFP